MDPHLREEINNLHARLCKGLADPNRILLLYRLAEAPATVSEMAEALEMAQPTVSRHLRILREKKMVAAQRLGQFISYELTDTRIIDALDLLRLVMTDNMRSEGNLAATFATNLKHYGIVSFVGALTLLLTVYAMTVFNKDEFNYEPEYSVALKAPFAHLSGNRSVQDYRDALGNIFDEADALAQQDSN